MHIEFSDAELDYVHRLLLARPMGEVEPIVANIRAQVSRQQAPARPANEPLARSGGDGQAVDDLPLP